MEAPATSEAGDGARAEATMLAVLAQTSRDIATQIKLAIEGKEKVRSHKRSQNWSK